MAASGSGRIRPSPAARSAAAPGATASVEVFGLPPGDDYVVTTQVLAWDDKRIHQFQRMYHAGDGFLAATCEWMNLHFNPATRRVVPWPEEIRARIADFTDNQAEHPWPAEVCGRMQVKEPVYSTRPDAV